MCRKQREGCGSTTMPARNCSPSILLENKELPHGQVEAWGPCAAPTGLVMCHSTYVALQLSRVRQFWQSGLGLGPWFLGQKRVAGNGGGKRRLGARPFGWGHADSPHDIAFAQHPAVGLAGDLLRHLED